MSDRELMQQALEAVRDRFFPADQPKADRDLMWDMVNDALRARLAEPDDEPWGWAILDKDGRERDTKARVIEFFGATKAVGPYPDGTVEREDREWPGLAPHRIVTLYTRPAARKVQPLTDEQIDRCLQVGFEHNGFHAPFDFKAAARAIERAHGIGDSHD